MAWWLPLRHEDQSPPVLLRCCRGRGERQARGEVKGTTTVFGTAAIGSRFEIVQLARLGKPAVASKLQDHEHFPNLALTRCMAQRGGKWSLEVHRPVPATMSRRAVSFATPSGASRAGVDQVPQPRFGSGLLSPPGKQSAKQLQQADAAYSKFMRTPSLSRVWGLLGLGVAAIAGGHLAWRQARCAFSAACSLPPHATGTTSYIHSLPQMDTAIRPAPRGGSIFYACRAGA